jgi:hypothetical protein
MFVLKIRKKRLLPRCFCNRETGCKRGEGEPAPWTITWSCVFLDHNLKLSPNRALLKGTVQRDRFGWKWYQSIDLSLNVRRQDFQLILTAHSRVRGPLSFRATSYEYLQLSRQFPIMVQTSCSALFLTPFCYSQLR